MKRVIAGAVTAGVLLVGCAPGERLKDGISLDKTPSIAASVDAMGRVCMSEMLSNGAKYEVIKSGIWPIVTASTIVISDPKRSFTYRSPTDVSSDAGLIRDSITSDATDGAKIVVWEDIANRTSVTVVRDENNAPTKLLVNSAQGYDAQAIVNSACDTYRG